MARPKTKNELLEQNRKRIDELLNFIDDLPDEVRGREFSNGTLNRNIKDVLGHLYHWHKMMLQWYKEGMSGKMPEMPAPGYTWRTVPALNHEINEMYKSESYQKVRKKLENSHIEVTDVISRHSDDDLFTKKKYKWTGSTSLAAYLISSTGSHYDWALKLIKKSIQK